MLTIGAFAGLRDAEIKRLDWSEVDLSRGHIEVKAAKAKSARRRIVSIQPNLAEWLRPFSGMTGRLLPTGYRGSLDRVRKAASLARWPQNGLRHSFASYRLAACHDAPRVAGELGHTSPQMLYSTYREVVLPEEAERYWMGGHRPGGVDLYVGGTEHAVLHLLYARFWHKVLFDLGHVSKPEPFQRLVNQGIILGEDNQKMSKSRGNIVNPDDVIDQHGADAFRCYEMFMGPLEQMKPWSTRGVEGVARFLARVWRLLMTENQAGKWELSGKVKNVEPDKAQQKVLHATIKKVTQDIESFSFNTAISQMMIFVNAFTNVDAIPVSAMRSFLVLLNPFSPHITSELWEKLNAKFSDAHGDITEQCWPIYDERLLVEDETEIVIQINGKVRDRMKMPILATEEELKSAALSNPKIQDRIAGKAVRKVIVVPKKLVNIVV